MPDRCFGLSDIGENVYGHLHPFVTHYVKSPMIFKPTCVCQVALEPYVCNYPVTVVLVKTHAVVNIGWHIDDR